jgi:hypothetical protein
MIGVTIASVKKLQIPAVFPKKYTFQRRDIEKHTCCREIAAACANLSEKNRAKFAELIF